MFFKEDINYSTSCNAAKFSSPLSVDDFIKKSSVIYYTKEALEKVKDKIICFAEKEGLNAHAESVRIRFEGGKK